LIHREAAVLSQITHPNIPTLYDHFVDGVGVARSLYLVQDYVRGGSPEERLITDRFTEVEVIGIVRQVRHIATWPLSANHPPRHQPAGQVHLIDFGSVRDDNLRLHAP
jgi:serine/threonine protein kinase